MLSRYIFRLKPITFDKSTKFLVGNVICRTFCGSRVNLFASEEKNVEHRKTIREIAASIDTTLTPEQKAYVETIKKSWGMGHKKRCK